MKRLPDAELSVMLVIWNGIQPMTANEILSNLDEKKWHIATLNKLLSRLIEKKFIISVTEGRPKKYGYLVKEEEYKNQESKSFFEKMHKNSFGSLVASLYADKGLSKEDIKEIETFVLAKKDGEH